jgi:hypothetical protein
MVRTSYVSELCVAPSEQFVSYVMVRTSYVSELCVAPRHT